MKKAISTVQIDGTKLTHTLEVECCDCGGVVLPPPGPDPDPDPQPGDPVVRVNGPILAPLFGESPLTLDIRSLPTHPLSREILAAVPPQSGFSETWLHTGFGPSGAGGMPYCTSQNIAECPVVAVTWPGEHDVGPYFIPLNAPIEPSGGDNHVLCVDEDRHFLYELMGAVREGAGYRCDNGTRWDLTKGVDQRPLHWTSADAAGLPITELLIRLDEFERAFNESDPENRCLSHAIRFTLPFTGRGFIPPARHRTTNGGDYSLPTRPPMGMRIRLNAAIDIDSIFTPASAILARTLQKKGGILADNGAPFHLIGTSDEGWSTYWNGLTERTGDRICIKNVRGPLLLDMMEVIAFADSDVLGR